MAEPYNPDEENQSNRSIYEMDDDDEDTEESEAETEEAEEEEEGDEEEYNLDEEENEFDSSSYELDDDEYTEEENESEEEEESDEEEYIPVSNSPRVSANVTLNSDSMEEGEGGELLLIGGKIGECSQGKEWNRTEIDGLFCPICMDAWTNEGDHRICCLPCGHLYGLSCIREWLRKKKSSAKCPQCNRECSLKDVRKLFAPRIVVIDNEAQETIRALEVKCALLEKKLRHQVEGKLGQLEVQTSAVREKLVSQNSMVKELAASQRSLVRKFERFLVHESSKGVQLDTPPGSPQH